MARNGTIQSRGYYTLRLPLSGYEALDVTHDLGMSWADVNAARESGNLAPTIVDFPNWEDVAGELDLPEAKPDLPLSTAALETLPMRLAIYLIGDTAINEALISEVQERRPFSKPR